MSYNSKYKGSEVDAALDLAKTALQEEQYKGTYSKPSTGIPKTDLATAVQTSLGKADTALQQHQDISGKLDKTEAASTYATKVETRDKQDKLVSGTNIKTINNQSILGSGNIIIEGGGSSSGGSGAYAEVNHGTSDTTFTLTPNTFHVWDEVSSLDLSFADEQAGVANEYLFQFTSGTTATTLTLPDVKWANDNAPTIAENMIYQVSILKGMASVLEFSNAASLITFEVNYVQIYHSYNAVPGMTWEAWVNSEYNTDNARVLSNGKILFGSYAVTNVVKDDVIGDLEVYYTSYYD